MSFEIFGIIYAGRQAPELKELARSRAVAALPVAGRYRAVDFMLSNLVNSGATNVGIVTQHNYHSLMDHVGSGKEWDLSRKRDGLFVLPPFVTNQNPGGMYRGTLDALGAVKSYIKRSTQGHVLFIDDTAVYNTTYNPMMRFHAKMGADITVLYQQEPPVQSGATEDTTRVYLYANEEGRIWDIEVNAAAPKTRMVSLGAYILSKALLERIIEECVARDRYDFIRDVLIRRMNDLKIYGFEHKGAVARIDTVQNYFAANMMFLDTDTRADLFGRGGPVYTKVKDEVPARYGMGGQVVNSLVADGCIIEGNVENSVLFRGVRVARNAVIKDSIVMQNSEVQEGASLHYTILDKSVVVQRDRVLSGSGNFPMIIRKFGIV
ncbi:MAG: glucose-1-phosphate adenylyltransferase subunit GlgD [Bacillota bacterium]